MNRDEWDIKGPSPNCSVCGRAFGDEEEIFSRLDLGAEGVWRTDFCSQCAGDGRRDGALSYWKTVYRRIVKERPSLAPIEVAEIVLRNLAGDSERDDPEVAYILAVMLERKKVLEEREVIHQPEKGRLRVYEHRKTGEVLVIRDPQISLQRVEEVGRRVSALLEAERQRLEAGEYDEPESGN